MVLSAVNLPLSDPGLLSAMLYLRQLSLTKQTPTAVVRSRLSRAGPAKNVSSRKKHRTCLTHMPSQWIRGSSRHKPTADGQHPTKVVYLWARGSDRIPPQQGGTCEPMGR